MLVPELVTVHEFGHQFWYGLVANNEFEEAWLDEGFTSYSSGARHGSGATAPHTSILTFLGLRLGGEELIRMQNSPRRTLDRVRQPAWTYSPDVSYSFYVYVKPELALRTLENLLGRETMARVLRTYHERWRFRHPSSDDFYAVAARSPAATWPGSGAKSRKEPGWSITRWPRSRARRAAPAAGLIDTPRRQDQADPVGGREPDGGRSPARTRAAS